MKLNEFLSEDELLELTFYASPCTKDCSGHSAGYKWSKSHHSTGCSSNSNSFNNGCRIAQQHRAQGRNPIGTGIRGTKGRFQKFQPMKR